MSLDRECCGPAERAKDPGLLETFCIFESSADLISLQRFSKTLVFTGVFADPQVANLDNPSESGFLKTFEMYEQGDKIVVRLGNDGKVLQMFKAPLCPMWALIAGSGTRNLKTYLRRVTMELKTRTWTPISKST